jgi:hypothetical protein
MTFSQAPFQAITSRMRDVIGVVPVTLLLAAYEIECTAESAGFVNPAGDVVDGERRTWPDLQYFVQLGPLRRS